MTTRTNPANRREFDVVLYGATGFVGQQTARYVAQHASEQTLGLKWAVAGRSQARLSAVLDGLGLMGTRAGLIVADATDFAALDQLASRAAVVLSTAGPYAKYGSELVAACVRHGTHYVDITGETPWVRQLIDDHDRLAGKAGTKIVPFCGFDSIPSDLGVAMLAHEFEARFGEPMVSVKSAFSLRGGGINGGTVASLMNIMDEGFGDLVRDPFLLNPAGTRPQNLLGHEDPIAPAKDADFGGWVGPFIMGPINSRVVRRSTALRGQSVQYQEFMRFGAGATGAAFATAVSLGSAVSQGVLKLGFVRKMAQRFVPQAGQGPSEAAMNNASFKCELVGQSVSGHRLRGLVADSGDAGNRVTTKLVCESALALALQFDELPQSAGVITPTHALGGALNGVLATRLRAAGMQIEVSAM